MAEALTIIILCAFAVTYVGYPAAILLLARRAPASAPPPAPLGHFDVSVIICAHNEAAAIGEKLQSVFAAAWDWGGKLEIVVADDGSTDGTAEAVAAAAEISAVPLNLLRLPRGGKAAALAAAHSAATGEILVYSDADPLWERQTLRALVAPFADPQVGAVAGEMRTLARGKGALRSGDTWFRRYETAIRKAEDRLFGCVSADGGLFALRASLAEPVPADATDDFFLSTAAVARGRRIAFREDARAYEHGPPGRRQHFRRRVRITVRGLTSLWRRRALMNPARTGWYSVGLIFHKLLRRLVPVLLIPLWALAGWLTIRGSGGFHLAIFAGLTALAALALLLLLTSIKVPRPLRLPLYVALHVGGLALGTLLFLVGRRYSQWTPQKEARPSGGDTPSDPGS